MDTWMDYYGTRAPHIFARIMAGEQVIVGDRQLDAIDELLKDIDHPAVSHYYLYFASVANPNRLGVHDQYLGGLKNKKYRGTLPTLTTAQEAAR